MQVGASGVVFFRWLQGRWYWISCAFWGAKTKQQVWLELHDYNKYKRESSEEQ